MSEEQLVNGVSYNGFDLYPRSFHTRDTGKWTIEVQIMRRNAVKPFSASNTFGTREEALQHAIRFGRQIIDGEIPNCTVDDL
jgi:hypothetical protein